METTQRLTVTGSRESLKQNTCTNRRIQTPSRESTRNTLERKTRARKESWAETESHLSLTAQFDQLVRIRNVLTGGEAEERFLEFTLDTQKNRRRWENSELECHRLNIELTKSAQEVSLLEFKLEQAREMLQKEIELRKKAEQDRDRLATKVCEVQNLVLSDNQLGRHTGLLKQMSGIVQSPFSPLGGYKGNMLPSVNVGDSSVPGNTTPQGSVHNVYDLTFDDTGELCQDSPLQVTRAGTHYGRRKTRSRSQGREPEPEGEPEAGKNEEELKSEEQMEVEQEREEQEQEQECVQECVQECNTGLFEFAVNVAGGAAVPVFSGETEQNVIFEDVHKVKRRGRRSCSMGLSSPMKRPRSCSLQARGLEAVTIPVSSTDCTDSPAGHQFVQKTVLKSEKCGACDKRMKFGKIGLRCCVCRLNIHVDCTAIAASMCRGWEPPPTSAPRSPQCGRQAQARDRNTNLRKQIFASPMLR